MVVPINSGEHANKVNFSTSFSPLDIQVDLGLCSFSIAIISCDLNLGAPTEAIIDAKRTLLSICSIDTQSFALLEKPFGCRRDQNLDLSHDIV